MIEKLLSLFGKDCSLQRRRLRKLAESSVKNCEFCHASVDCDKRVCRNCLSPFAKGLRAEKWLSSSMSKPSHLTKVDAVKYAATGQIANFVKEGCKTFQKLTVTKRLRTS